DRQRQDAIAADKKTLQDIIANAQYETQQAQLTGLDKTLAALAHQKSQELDAIAKYSAISSALYAEAVSAINRKFDTLTQQAIQEDLDKKTQDQADKLAKVSTLLETITHRADAEIASLTQYKSAGAFYDAVIHKID